MATRSFRAKHETVYGSKEFCERYDAELCSRQDWQGNLLKLLQRIVPRAFVPASARSAADVGAGTGKLARLLAPHMTYVVATDRSAEAIDVAQTAVGRACATCQYSFHVADLRSLPIADESVDLVVVGWAVSYLKSDHEEWNHADGTSSGPWREEVDAALAEFERICRPGGTVVILETHGTAVYKPQRLGSWLYAYLRQAGLQEALVRTDYLFPNKRDALETLRFFFGKGVANRARALLAEVDDDDTGLPCIVPEFTGVWWRSKADGCTHAGDGD